MAPPTGHIELSWETRDLDGGVRLLLLTWAERGGPEVKEPGKAGAGSELIFHGLGDAEVTRDFRPTGLVCSIKVPLTKTGRAA